MNNLENVDLKAFDFELAAPAEQIAKALQHIESGFKAAKNAGTAIQEWALHSKGLGRTIMVFGAVALLAGAVTIAAQYLGHSPAKLAHYFGFSPSSLDIAYYGAAAALGGTTAIFTGYGIAHRRNNKNEAATLEYRTAETREVAAKLRKQTIVPRQVAEGQALDNLKKALERKIHIDEAAIIRLNAIHRQGKQTKRSLTASRGAMILGFVALGLAAARLAMTQIKIGGLENLSGGLIPTLSLLGSGMSAIGMGIDANRESKIGRRKRANEIAQIDLQQAQAEIELKQAEADLVGEIANSTSEDAQDTNRCLSGSVRQTIGKGFTGMTATIGLILLLAALSGAIARNYGLTQISIGSSQIALSNKTLGLLAFSGLSSLWVAYSRNKQDAKVKVRGRRDDLKAEVQTLQKRVGNRTSKLSDEMKTARKDMDAAIHAIAKKERHKINKSLKTTGIIAIGASVAVAALLAFQVRSLVLGQQSFSWNGLTLDSKITSVTSLATTAMFIANAGFDLWKRGEDLSHEAEERQLMAQKIALQAQLAAVKGVAQAA